ncbi:MAG TPA: hypothetical protein VGF46_12170 [Gaiellales bacterium]
MLRSRDDELSVIVRFMARVAEIAPGESMGMIECSLDCRRRDDAIALVLLRRGVGPDCEVFAFRGGKFAVLLPGASLEDTVETVERAQAMIADAPERKAAPLVAGIAWCPPGGDRKALVAVAHDAYEQARSHGGTLVIAAGESGLSAGSYGSSGSTAAA